MNSSPPTPDVSIRAVDVVPGAAFIVAMVAGLAGVLGTDAVRSSPDLPLWDGQWGEAWEDALDEEMFFRDFATEAWAVAEYATFGNGRAGVVVGEDGWLFTSEEFQDPAGAHDEVFRKARVVFAVELAMRARDVELVVALLPAKARVEAAHLGSARVPAAVLGRRDDFLVLLESVGIPVVDLEPALAALPDSNPAFLRTDTHWTSHGASAAAGAIATRVRTVPRDWLDSATVTVAPGPPTEHRGDLYRYLPLGVFADLIGPASDTLFTPVVRVDSGLGLLDDTSVPVALVGTSYSEDPRWGFLGAVQAALGSDVINAATQGKGPFSAMLAYLENPAWTESPPKLVVWEIPERYLGMPDEFDGYAFWKTHQQFLEGQ